MSSLAIVNVGEQSCSVPRFMVNEGFDLRSYRAIVARCLTVDDDPTAVLLCLKNVASRHVRSWMSRICPGEQAMDTLHYRGFGLCGQAAEVVAQLLRCAGFEACVVGYAGHVAVEVVSPQLGTVFLDPFRGYFYVDDGYRRLLSLAETTAFGGWASSPGYAPKRPDEPGARLQGWFNRRQLHPPEVFRSCSTFCAEDDLEEFWLRRTRLEPGDRLVYRPAEKLPAYGATAYLERTLDGSGRFSLQLPYPMVSLRVRGERPFSLEIERPLQNRVSSQGGGVEVRLEKDVRCTRAHDLSFVLKGEAPVHLQVAMRYAEKSLPSLEEGVNRIAFLPGREGSEPGRVEVDLAYTARRIR